MPCYPLAAQVLLAACKYIIIVISVLHIPPDTLTHRQANTNTLASHPTSFATQMGEESINCYFPSSFFVFWGFFCLRHLRVLSISAHKEFPHPFIQLLSIPLYVHMVIYTFKFYRLLSILLELDFGFSLHTFWK